MVHEYLINEKEVEIMAENLVNTFVTQVIENSDYEELDRIYLTNKVFTLVGEGVADVETDSSELIDLKDQLLQAGVKAGSVGELNEEQDIIGAQLMDLITPRPSVVNRNFQVTVFSWCFISNILCNGFDFHIIISFTLCIKVSNCLLWVRFISIPEVTIDNARSWFQ